MTRPHEETWIADDEYGIVHAEPEVRPDGRSFVRPIADFHAPFFLDQHMGGFTDDERARARLAAQAPAMARLLLQIEWAGDNDGQTGPFCLYCHGIQPGLPATTYGAGDHIGHRDGCEFVAVLRAAGALATP